MTKSSAVITAMIGYDQGDARRIAHFLKVYALAKAIGEEEGLDAKTQEILEIAAITHDIGIKISEEKYGNCSGKHQEEEGPPLARALLTRLHFGEDIIDRVCLLIGKHHTYTHIEGSDHQILVEADFLVNLHEDNASAAAIAKAGSAIFRTGTGLRYLKAIFRQARP